MHISFIRFVIHNSTKSLINLSRYGKFAKKDAKTMYLEKQLNASVTAKLLNKIIITSP